MRVVTTLALVALIASQDRLAGQTAGYATRQAMGEGTTLRVFVEVTAPADVEIALRDAAGIVGRALSKSITPKQPWLDKVTLTRPVGANSTLQVGVTTTPRVGYRFGVSIEEFKVGIVNGVPRVQGTSAPIIREPVQCTSQACDVCYTLEQYTGVQFDSYTVSERW
jgi:hypothetical protein